MEFIGAVHGRNRIFVTMSFYGGSAYVSLGKYVGDSHDAPDPELVWLNGDNVEIIWDEGFDHMFNSLAGVNEEETLFNAIGFNYGPSIFDTLLSEKVALQLNGSLDEWVSAMLPLRLVSDSDFATSVFARPSVHGVGTFLPHEPLVALAKPVEVHEPLVSMLRLAEKGVTDPISVVLERFAISVSTPVEWVLPVFFEQLDNVLRSGLGYLVYR